MLLSLLSLALTIASVLGVTHLQQNPILPGWNPDPTILRVGEDYFIATSTFEYFPGHPIYHSKNLVDWTLVGHGLNRPSQLALFGTPSDAGVWAPSLRYHDGTYYLTSTTRYAMMATYSGTPTEMYTFVLYHSSYVLKMLFQVYLTWSGINNNEDKIYSIYQSKIDLETGTSLTPAEIIFNGTLPHDSAARPEGPHIYHVNSTYYLLIAEGGTGITHRSTIQRSTTSPAGPWENNPNNPILYNGANTSLSVQNTGHADIVQAIDGSWWGVALGVRPQGAEDDDLRLSREQLGRETFLFPVKWVDGWPVFNNGRPLSEVVLLHEDADNDGKGGITSRETSIEETKIPDSESFYYNNFKSHTLDNSFYFLRTPYAPFHTLLPSGSLEIKPNSYAIGDRDSPAMILRKQTSHQEVFETELEFSKPRTRLEEAGISIFYGDSLHNEIGVSGGGPGEGRSVVVRTVTLNQQTTYISLSSTTEPVRLRIEASPMEYTLLYAEGKQGDWNEVARFDGSVLSIPPAGGFFFKGAAFAIYNTGNGKPSLTKARFGYWKQGQFS
ncbi:hypothetical protein AGABI2DRAFT_211524 [Agaricus bisporus var. bisporus H97]|uniref:hypothetical protein n=1 Tax=Agaricus bisporus var. bisporus (strain H97 / ATCC MYA-4626 / FGSC 10389) TaxID=936046 RepID=UPI00029F5642|nr:hypothetical protein AGABI2DRAFT_211524 [Agaricus bisporus var. bisporus H97]EKV42824.1 hypothetical protein AGABI2DRAFT_211524 [Agaricus bisporus var. bisporus H97]